MTAAALEGRTEHESQQYRLDHGHRVAAVQAFAYIGRVIDTDPAYPLPPCTEDIIALAAATMQEIHTRRTADAEAFVAARREAIYASLDEMRAERTS